MDTCPHCSRRYEGGKVQVGFMHCSCPTRDVGGGHMTKWCLRCGWYRTDGHDPAGWYRDPGVIRVSD